MFNALFIEKHKSFRSSLTIFCALLSLGSIIVLSEYNNDNNIIISQLLSQKSKLIQVSVAISIIPSDFHGTSTATVSNVQFPGIIPNINNSIPASPPISRPPPIIRNTRAPTAPGGPKLYDPNLRIEQISTGLKLPTSMAFLGPNDILVLEKDTGNQLYFLLSL